MLVGTNPLIHLYCTPAPDNLISQSACPFCYGTSIQVHATDADSEPYAKPRYSLLQNELFTSNFEMEPQTGWIVTYADIDREAQSVYQLIVLAIDGWQNDTHEDRNTMARFSPSKTSSQHTATTRVQIRVLDENDNAPEFRGPRQFAVEENQPANTWIADLQVMDRDEGLNKEVEFVLTSQSLLDGKSENTAKNSESNNSVLSHGVLPLRLSSNGSLYTKTKLDRENQVFMFSDSGLKDNRTVTDPLEQDINTEVTDVVVPVSVHEGPGYCALIAEAEDADEGRNALLRYDIKSFGMESEISHTVTAFMMDPQSGRMMLARHLSTEEIGTHSITLTVDDSGSPSKQAELVVQLQIEDSPMRGNWLLPENELARTASSNSKGDYMEGHTILIVIVLSGISAFLASVLISAILCMIKPCRGSTRTRDSVRFTKGTGAAQSGKYGQGGTTQNKCPGNYADYNLSLLDMNGYAGGVDPAMDSRASQMTAAQIPGLEQLYLPSDKLIGVDSSFQTCSSIMEDASWPGCSNVSTLLGSQPLDRISPPVPMCEYTITQPLNNSWNNTTQARTNIWTTATIGSSNTPAGYSAHCTNCHDTVTQPNSPLRLGFTTDNNSTVAHPIASMVTPFQMTQFLPPLLSERDERDCAEYDGSDLGKVHPRTCKPNRIVTLGIGVSCQEPTPDLAGAPVGEEQRSDSGRGASDEVIGSQTAPNTSFNGKATKVRSATLRSTQENASHMMSGLVFPSLPRISSGE
ncbi:Protocadherin-16 [Fasciola gigantica]|uniref:Protocadherin-16 n=1 Tax=Fasciola gigantica TaxID=46835 RepID=A0A504YL14_FASGI|nr:Protocadherin-16 [Fasciola gigantica]